MLIDISKIKGCIGDTLVVDTALDISELDPAFSRLRFPERTVLCVTVVLKIHL